MPAQELSERQCWGELTSYYKAKSVSFFMQSNLYSSKNDTWSLNSWKIKKSNYNNTLPNNNNDTIITKLQNLGYKTDS